MAELVSLLGTLSVLLTLVGTYRFTSFFFTGGSALAGIIALAVTVGFLILFEQIIFLTGLGVFLLPVCAAIYWRDKLPLIGPALMKQRSSSGRGSTKSSGSSGSDGSLGGSPSRSGGSNRNSSSSGSSTGNSTGSSGMSAGGSSTATMHNQQLVCPNCGTANNSSANFCENDQCLQRLSK